MTASEVPPPDLETKSVPRGHGAVSYSEISDDVQPAHVTPPRGDQGGIIGTSHEDAADQRDDKSDS